MHKRIRVMLAINDFMIGGAQRLYIDICNGLDPSIYDLHLVTFFLFPERKNMYASIPGYVQVHRCNFKGVWDIQAWKMLIAYLRSTNPDVILSSLFFSNTIMRCLSMLLSKKVITIEHNTYINKAFLHRCIDTFFSRWTYIIVAVSESVMRFTSAQEHIPLSRFRVIPNGIDVERIRKSMLCFDRSVLRANNNISEHTLVILNVARLTEQKNQLALIDGFIMFAKKNPDTLLLIVGEGALRSTLQARIDDIGNKHIRLVGAQTDVIPWYVMSDFLVSASFIEGFGIAHAEALACGIPVLSTKTAGPDEMIYEGKNGLFIKGPTSSQIASGLECMAMQYKEMNLHALTSVSRYDIRTTVDKYDALLREVANKV